MKTYFAIFLSIFIAELGDKTQLATLLFATEPGSSKAGVFVAATLALATSTLIAVLLGARLGGWISPDYLRVAAGLGFLAIGAWFLVGR